MSKRDPRKPSQEEIDELDLGDDPVKPEFEEDDSQLLSDANQNRIAAIGTLAVFAILGYFAVKQGYVDLGPLEQIFGDVWELVRRFQDVREDGIFGGAAGGSAPAV